MPEIPTPDWIPQPPEAEKIVTAIEELFPVVRKELCASGKLNGSERWMHVADPDDLMMDLAMRRGRALLAHLNRMYRIRMAVEVITREPRLIRENGDERLIPGDSVEIPVPAGIAYRCIDGLRQDHRLAIASRLVSGEWAALTRGLREEEGDEDCTMFVDYATASLHVLFDEIRNGALLASALERRREPT